MAIEFRRVKVTAPSFVEKSDSKQAAPDDPEVDQLSEGLLHLSTDRPATNRTQLRELVQRIGSRILGKPENVLSLKNNPKIKFICQRIGNLTANGSRCFEKSRGFFNSTSQTKTALIAFKSKMDRLCLRDDRWESLVEFYLEECQEYRDWRVMREMYLDLLKECMSHIEDTETLWASFEKIRGSGLFIQGELDQFVSWMCEMRPKSIGREELYEYLYGYCKPLKMPHVLSKAFKGAQEFWYNQLVQAVADNSNEEISFSFPKVTGLCICPRTLINRLPPDLAWKLEIVQYVATFDPIDLEFSFKSYKENLAESFYTHLKNGDAENLFAETKKLAETCIFSEFELGYIIYKRNDLLLLINVDFFDFCFGQYNYRGYVIELNAKYGYVFTDDYREDSTDPKQRVTALLMRYGYRIAANQNDYEARFAGKA